MATFQKRAGAWRAIVRKRGQYASDTFRTKAEAQQWALAKELEFAAMARGEVPPDRTVADLLARFIEENDPDKPDRLRLQRAMTGTLGGVPLAQFAAQHVVAWRDARLREVSSASVLREWNALSSICTRAVREWRWLKSNPFREVSRPAAPLPRARRPEGNELERILFCLGYEENRPCTTKAARVGAAAVWAVETAMRAGEICALRPEDVSGRVAHLKRTKNGEPRDVPLSQRAMAVWAQLPDGFFNLEPRSVDALWRKARAKAAVDGLHFHDLRREALTRLARKLDVLDLARVSGHRNLKILLNVYYRPSIEELAGRLD